MLQKNTGEGREGAYMSHSHETAPNKAPHAHMQMKGPYMRGVLQSARASIANAHVQRPHSGAAVAVHALGLRNEAKARKENT